MTLTELKKLAHSATPGKVISHDQEYDSWVAIVDEKTKAVSPAKGEEEMRNLEDFKKEWRSFVPDTSDEMNCSAPMTWFGIIYLLDSLDTQESELTKLRKRVKVLQEALSFYGNPESWIIRDKHYWRKSSPKSQGDDELIKDYHHPNRDWIGTVVVGGKRARQALSESAKIAGRDE